MFKSPGFVCKCDWVGSKDFNPEDAILLHCLRFSVLRVSIRRPHPPWTPIVHSICSVCRWKLHQNGLKMDPELYDIFCFTKLLPFQLSYTLKDAFNQFSLNPNTAERVTIIMFIHRSSSWAMADWQSNLGSDFELTDVAVGSQGESCPGVEVEYIVGSSLRKLARVS